MELKKQLPNIASSIRILGALVLPFLMWESWSVNISLPVFGQFVSVPLVWLIVYLILVFTDKVDGTLARRLNATSELGALLDTIGDALLLIVGVFCVILHIARDALSTAEVWLDSALVVLLVAYEVLVFLLTMKFHGTGNCVHTWAHKAASTLAFFFVFFWAFYRDIPQWMLILVVVAWTYAIVDEAVYIVRTANYDVDFKGHGLEKYLLRETS